MQLGLGVLGLAPREFWAMTPRELAAAIDGRLGAAGASETPPSRNDLAALISAYPDQHGEKHGTDNGFG